MANNPITTPPQTGGMKAAASLGGARGGNAAYLKARGAKPVDGMGTTGGGPTPPISGKPGVSAGSAGNLGKGRRMRGKPISSANRVGRDNGGPKPPVFAKGNGVPVGGRTAPPSGGVRGTAGRAQEFLASMRPKGAPPTGSGSDATGASKVGLQNSAKPGGGNIGALGTALGGGGMKPPSAGPVGAARGAMGALKPKMPPVSTQPSPPAGAPSTGVLPPSRRPPLLSPAQGPAGGGGGGANGNPARQRPSVA
jgi:hypothetical protein